MHLCYDNYVNELQAIHDQIDDKELRFMFLSYNECLELKLY